MAQISKGVRVMLQLKNSPEALVEHVNEVASSAQLRVSAYLCALFEQLHGDPITEKTVPLHLVEVPPRAKSRTADQLTRPGDSKDMLATRVPVALADHMSRVARAQGFAGRATYAYALVAQAHGFPCTPVQAWRYDDPRLNTYGELGHTGS